MWLVSRGPATVTAPCLYTCTTAYIFFTIFTIKLKQAVMVGDGQSNQFDSTHPNVQGNLYLLIKEGRFLPKNFVRF
jgi:hypothetical protein